MKQAKKLVAIQESEREELHKKIKRAIGGSAPEVNGNDAISLAVIMTHEVSHLERARNLENQFAELPFALKLRKLQEEIKNPEKRAREEARAHAIEARAYIIQSGLFGVEQRPRLSDLDKRAAVFALLDDEADERWINYLKEKYLTNKQYAFD